MRMSKQRRSIAIGDLVRISSRWSADYRNLYAFGLKDYFYVETTYPLTRRSIVCVLMPGGIPCRRSHLKRPRMKKVERDAMFAALQRKAAVDFFAEIPTREEPPGDQAGLVVDAAPGGGGDPGIIPINELASPFSPEEQGLADAINNDTRETT